jgi:hypothetical protein
MAKQWMPEDGASLSPECLIKGQDISNPAPVFPLYQRHAPDESGTAMQPYLTCFSFLSPAMKGQQLLAKALENNSPRFGEDLNGLFCDEGDASSEVQTSGLKFLPAAAAAAAASSPISSLVCIIFSHFLRI